MRAVKFLVFYFIACALLLNKVSADTCPDKVFFTGAALEGNPVTTDMLFAAEKQMGIKPGIILFFMQWAPDDNVLDVDFPCESLNAIRNFNAVPCLSWEPMYYKNGAEIPVYSQVILMGVYDSYIRAYARAAKKWGHPFIIRFAHEMNLGRYRWGNLTGSYIPETPALYAKIYRRVVDIFKKEGADNVLWAFCPNVDSVPNTKDDASGDWNKIKNYYPGDEYVDILGLDGYNWGVTQTKEKNGWDSSWRSFSNLFETPYNELKILSASKPVFVFETASSCAGGDKIQWIKDAFTSARKMGFSGIIWFEANKEIDWRVNCHGNFNLNLGGITPESGNPQEWIKGIKNEKR